MIGQVLAIVAALVGICISAWALMVTCGLLFPARSETARAALLENPKGTIALGLVLALVPGFVGVVMLGLPLPGVKLMGMVILLSVLACGALGGAGLSFIAGDRIQGMASDLSDYAVFVRGAGFLVVASVFPVLGWLFFAPLALSAAVGSGAKAVVRTMISHRRGVGSAA